jgi:hypothetical protein
VPGILLSSRTDSFKQNLDIGTVRLDYTFDGLVVAKYRSRREADFPEKGRRSRWPFCWKGAFG